MARLRHGVAPWIDRVPTSKRPRYGRLRGQVEVDVVVVGGGMTGCLTAHALAMAGLSTAVIEAGRIGQGTTGHGLGIARIEPATDFTRLHGAHGLRTTRDVWRAARRGAQDLAAALRRLRVGCDLAAVDLLEVALDGEDERELRRSYAARSRAGLDVSWLDARALRTRTRVEGTGAVRTRGNVLLDPYRACVGVARAAARRGAQIFEGSEVLRVRSVRDGVEVHTGGGVAEAATAVLATGMPPPGARALRRHVTLLETYAVMTPSLPPAVRREMGRRDAVLRDSASPPRTLRWTRDGRVVFSGADQAPPHPRARERTLIQRTGQLMYELSTLYPVISGIQPEYGWSASYGVTKDGVPYVGPHRSFPRQLFALGVGPGGPGLSMMASRTLLRHVRSEATPADLALGFTRR